MNSPGSPARWKKLRTEPLATTRVFDVVRAFFQHPRREKEREFFVIQAPEWVNVIAVTPEQQIVLVRQFRYGINDVSLEIPGGIVEAGEDPVEAGLRELQEETGFVGSNARLLGTVHPNPAIQNNRCHFLLVENARRAADLAWDDDEELEVLTKPVPEVYALAQQGDIRHALVLDALLLFLLDREKKHTRPA